MKDFGSFLKKKRKSLGLTQVEFGGALGLSYITIWRWENGIGEKPAAYKINGIKNAIKSLEKEKAKNE